MLTYVREQGCDSKGKCARKIVPGGVPAPCLPSLAVQPALPLEAWLDWVYPSLGQLNAMGVAVWDCPCDTLESLLASSWAPGKTDP